LAVHGRLRQPATAHLRGLFARMPSRNRFGTHRARLLAQVAGKRLAMISPVFCLLQSRSLGVEAEGRWVATWGCGVQLTEPANLPPAPLAKSTLRQFVHVTLGGKCLRVRLSNAYGTNPVMVTSIHVALAAGAGSAGKGEIDPLTDKPLAFRGALSINIGPGDIVTSDPVDFCLPALTNLAVTMSFGDGPATTVSGHPGSRTTSFIKTGDAVTSTNMEGAAKTPHWYFLAGVDVLAEVSGKAVVVLGDSITDGRGSTTDANDRWPDNLAERLASNAPTAGVSVLNMGIGGNGIFAGLGPAAVKRFERDVLNQAEARWVIVFEGVNDIGSASTRSSSTVATNSISAYQQFVVKAHGRNMRAYCATITPFGGNRYFTTAHEAARQTINAWIRTNSQFDAVIDFDAAVRDPITRTNLLPAFDTGDGLHLNPAGYRAMANAIDLGLFAP
jgi:lysophospholipase L1-like esterase